ncbi:MAG: enterobactin synthetase component D [Bradymonadia bacterium]|jgi:enterobactin synthetase component D
MRSPFDASIAFAQAQGAASDVLLAAELACLSPRAVLKRRADFINGRAAAAACLAQLDHPRVAVARAEDRSPIWPAGLVGALTHSGGQALAAVGRGAEWSAIGLDLEHLSGLRRIEIADRVADTAERAWIGDDRRRLLALFSAKESIFKALYPRFQKWFGFDAVRLRATSTGFDALVLQPLDRPVGSIVPVGVRWMDDAVLTWVSLRSSFAPPHRAPPI